ncbi:MAG: S-methyl-5-thioribose-1-phosphate isomerase [Elusimicrobiota bacterium]
MIKTFYWRDGAFYILNQLLLPHHVVYVPCRRSRDVANAIQTMVVRGAPAIGVAAAFGMALAAREKKNESPLAHSRRIMSAAVTLGATRPTAVNLFWALERMKKIVAGYPTQRSQKTLADLLLQEAQHMLVEDIAVNKKIGDFGASLLKKNSVVLTHCNAGALATAGYGTALGVVRSAHRQGKIKLVFVDETRPYLQGSRLTAWEMKQEKIPYCLITDSMAGHCMKTAGITAVIVGADRIAANGDTANKIGTYALSILARHHHIPFYVAAPLSTIDGAAPTGDDIVIEERPGKEVLFINNKSIAPTGTVARHPGFDVTPAGHITAIITEKGVVKPSALKTRIARPA